MKPILIGILTVTLATTMLASGAQKAEDAERLLRAAMNTELVDGNLQAAIEQYKKVAQSGNRALAAQALIRMAECYQKLGDTEAQKIYERVVRDYADQKEAAATARARLGNNATVSYAGIVTRRVWSGPKADITGSVSRDGRYLSFYVRETGDLGVRDLTTGKDRRLTNKGTWADSSDWARQSAISPDGRQVAYVWFKNKDLRHDLRLIGLDGGGPATPRVLYDNEDVPGLWLADWSPDGKWVAILLRRKDRTTQIGLVSAADGSLRVLKSVDWRGPTKTYRSHMFFSPDGEYLAFDLPAGEGSEQRDVFVLATDGSREIPAVVHPANDVAVGWTPDGKHLLFKSDRNSSMSLWALPFFDGKPQGTAELIKSDVGPFAPMGMTRSGALYFGVFTGNSGLYTAAIDFNSGRVLMAPVPVAEGNGWAFSRFSCRSAADWSPDGKFLAYAKPFIGEGLGPDRTGGILAIRSVETGQTRELHPQLSSTCSPRWAPDGRSFVVAATDLKGRRGIYRIDAQTGDIEALVLDAATGLSMGPQWAANGKKIFYRRSTTGEGMQGMQVVIERDLASGREREMFRAKGMSVDFGRWDPSASPDGRYLAWTLEDRANKQSTLVVIPIEGGEPRELAADPRNVIGATAWTPDSRIILFEKGEGIWQIPAGGGQPRKIDLNFGPPLSPRVHPDGKQVVFSIPAPGNATTEVWVMENFLDAKR